MCTGLSVFRDLLWGIFRQLLLGFVVAVTIGNGEDGYQTEEKPRPEGRVEADYPDGEADIRPDAHHQKEKETVERARLAHEVK